MRVEKNSPDEKRSNIAKRSSVENEALHFRVVVLAHMSVRVFRQLVDVIHWQLFRGFSFTQSQYIHHVNLFYPNFT